MSEQAPTISVYRVENPSIPAVPNGTTSHEDLIGQWFSLNLDAALVYLRKATQTFGRDAAPADGGKLLIAHIPVDQLDGMHVYNSAIASRMDVESDNYLVPRDGSVSIDAIALDEVIGDLRGELGNINRYQEARGRVHAVVGELAVNQ